MSMTLAGSTSRIVTLAQAEMTINQFRHRT